MPAVRRVQKRNATITIEAHAEVAFGPTGPMPGWTRRASQAVRGAVIRAAPTNKRPRWGHYGAPLKKTIKASTEMDPTNLKAYFAVGSTAHYATFVDQGTKAFQAKILPPWKSRGYELYEHTWVPPGQSKAVGKITVQGQKAQHFFAEGLDEGMAAMGIVTQPSTGVQDAATKFPKHLTDFVGPTPNDSAFRTQLAIWRKERDKAWKANSRNRKRKARTASAAIKNAAAAAAKAKADKAAAKNKHSSAVSKLEAARAKRKQEQIDQLVEKQKAKDLAKVRREEAEAKQRAGNMQRAAIAKAKAEANKYAAAIRAVYPDAEVQVSNGAIKAVRVVYSGPDGRVIEYFYRSDDV